MDVHSRMTNKTNDGFKNVHRNLGSSRDVTTNTGYIRNPYISLHYQTCNGLYVNPMGGKVVDIPIEDAFRGGRVLSGENQSRIEDYQNVLKQIKLEEKLETGMKWGKIFGSAVAIIISDDDEMSEPLVLDNIKKGDIKDIIVLDRWQLYTMDVNRDPMSSNFLKPEKYYVTRTSSAIHHTRVIRFDGMETTLYDKELMNGWGLSVYEKVYKAIQNAQMSPDLLINLLTQLNVDVYHIKGLNESLTNCNDKLAIKRIQTAQEGKSIYNGVALDAEDQYTNINKSLAGTKETNEIFTDFLCMAADIPKTRFMGLQNSGLANDGSGDLKNYYDRVEANERTDLRSVYDYLDPILTKSLYGEVLEFDYTMESLFQMTPEQESIIRNRNAQTNQIYLNTDVLNEMEVKATLATDEYYSTVTPESVEEEEKELEAMNEGANEFDNIDEYNPVEEPKETKESPLIKDEDSLFSKINKVLGK